MIKTTTENKPYTVYDILNELKNDKDKWTFLVYPESAPENWRDVINAMHIAWVESPLHNADTNADETQKKPHYHVMLTFEGKKSYAQIEAITESVNATIPQKVANAKGLVRYMVHMDNPEKAQYKVSDIVCHGGANVADLLAPTKTERYGLVREMMGHVKREQITEFSDLMDYAMAERFDDWFPLLCDNSAFVLEKYIKSIWRKNAALQSSPVKVVLIDKETGEVVQEFREPK